MRVSQPTTTDLEKDYVWDAVFKNDIGVGDYIPRFEQAWAEYNKMKYGIACSNGTNALYLALKALGIGKGDEVIVPEYTMIATAWAVSYTGATPIFLDCGDDLNIDVSLIEDAISPRTKAIMPVHVYGRRCNMDEIMEIAKGYNLFVVEDMAEAHGIIPVGDIACYSFYGNKILATGEGGMCLTENRDLAEEIRLLANMYFDKERKMLHPKIGHNFRMTNIQAAIGMAQVERIDEILAKRNKIAKWYDKHLPKSLKMPHREVLWMYDIQTDIQEKLKQELAKNEVETRYGFKPMSQQPMYFDETYKYLNAYKWSNKILYLPTYYDMEEKDVKYVCKLIINIINNE